MSEQAETALPQAVQERLSMAARAKALRMATGIVQSFLSGTGASDKKIEQEAARLAETFIYFAERALEGRAQMAAEAVLQSQAKEISALRARLVMAEQHKALSLLGKTSYQEVVEDKLREALAEAQVRADAIEMKYRALRAALKKITECGCECTGFYRCNGCERVPANIAEAALKEHNEDTST